MKFIPSLVFAALLLCYPSLKAQAALNADDVKFLKGCSISQADIDVTPNLPRAGQNKLRGFLLSEGRTCEDIAPFKATREFLKVFTPPPNQSPLPPKEYDRDFLTQAEADYVTNVNKGILDKLFGWFTGK
jgi:hypothetical protein